MCWIAWRLILFREFVLTLTLFLICSFAGAAEVAPIDKELSDMYKLYLARLSDPAVETILSIKPMIEFYDDEANLLLDSLTMNVRRLYPGLKSRDMLVIIYMAVYETLVAEDDLYVYPTLAEYNKNIFNLEKSQQEFEHLKLMMDSYRAMNEEQSTSYIFDQDKKYQNIFYEYNLAQGELDSIKELGDKIKFRFDLNLQRRKMLQEALRECLSRLLIDELGL